MTDATPGGGQRKGVWARLTTAADRWIWQRPNQLAREQGWEIDRSRWGGRTYRDPRFDQRKKELLENEPERGPSQKDVAGQTPSTLSGSEAYYRRSAKIPRAHDLVAVAGLLWRWRAELALAGATPLVVVPLLLWTGPWAPLLAVAAAAVCLGLPIVRRAATRLVVRHRFQSLCLRTSMRTPEGRMPLVVHTQSIPGGVAMLVWCRSGMSPELIEAHIPEIKVACFAKEVTIYRSERWAHLLTVELKRA
ncbi:hypothetical protein [Nonomuraea sp. SYSU D8015]|uniref:hypothetical protein n=1 Tax=Nonomuraea sp. SYSU D8015 TaxID=2593644 RepID=UPI001660ED87|nr:hypothetical protein [Nonomuraea sp. SYSU D8015]